MTTAASSDPRLYMKLAATLRTQIADGTLAKGARMPSISVLCEEYSLSRQTAGKALRMLEDEALIHRVPGLGYHVT
ncbi:MAG: winged helix-turn-helix transcriptional regulator [Streptosporangiaceae bacterium]|nr:winged helix-turn-helix transcriptional regulator [Streptosporangiaceae bacterium]